MYSRKESESGDPFLSMSWSGSGNGNSSSEGMTSDSFCDEMRHSTRANGQLVPDGAHSENEDDHLPSWGGSCAGFDFMDEESLSADANHNSPWLANSFEHAVLKELEVSHSEMSVGFQNCGDHVGNPWGGNNERDEHLSLSWSARSLGKFDLSHLDSSAKSPLIRDPSNCLQSSGNNSMKISDLISTPTASNLPHMHALNSSGTLSWSLSSNSDRSVLTNAGDSTETNVTNVTEKRSATWQTGEYDPSLSQNRKTMSDSCGHRGQNSQTLKANNAPSEAGKRQVVDNQEIQQRYQQIHTRTEQETKKSEATTSSAVSAQAMPVLPLFVKAAYSVVERAVPLPLSESYVMSATRKEWMSKLNVQKKEVLKGKIQAIGQLKGQHEQIIRSIMVVEPHSVPQIKALLRIRIPELAHIGKTSYDLDVRSKHAAVGKPCFSPYETGTLALGTELHPTNDFSACLTVANVQRSPATKITSLASINLERHVSSLAWLSSNELLVSSGKELQIMKLHENLLRIRSQLPEFHTDDIRDMQLNPFRTNCCLSGGYDGKLFITDLVRVVSDQLSGVKTSQNVLYRTSDSVSSVSWNPVISNMASATTDSGVFHVFDPRMNCNDRRTTVLQTGVGGLNTHGWVDASSVLLGFGDGSMRLFDVRKPFECVVVFRDPHVQQIGDLVFDPQRRYLLTFGRPDFSVWRSESASFTLLHHDAECVPQDLLNNDPYFKTSGSFMLTGGRQHGIFGVTDTAGNFSLYDLHTANYPVVAISDTK